MTVQRINGWPVNLQQMTDDEVWRLAEYIGRNLDAAERELTLVNQELTRRSLVQSFDPAPAS
jgi:hypothetical protein